VLTYVALAPTYLSRFIDELVALDPAELFRDRRVAVAVLLISTFAIAAR
jgi:hypothetical protein